MKIFLVYLLVIAGSCHATAQSQLDIKINDEIEVTLEQYGQGPEDGLLLWLPSESGLLAQERQVAMRLADLGYSVYLADVLSAWFLPALASSVDQLPPRDLAILVEKIRQISGKKIYLIGNGRGALLSLRVAQAWEQTYGEQADLGGVIMLSPKLFVETPEPGQAGELMPVTYQANASIMIIQPALSPWRWKLDRSVPALEKSGSDVYTWVLPDVRDRFYYRPDATDKEEQVAKRLPNLLSQSVRLLQQLQHKSRFVNKQNVDRSVKIIEGKKERALRPFAGDSDPPTLVLQDIHGQMHNLKQYQGKVVLVNFWASWCPPCVHEMPSMQALKNRFDKKDFEILAVNMAEDKSSIERFLKEKVKVDFTILQDKDGQALKRWQVFAFPTSYVIDRQGKISLALFGAIDWMQDDVVRQIEALIEQ